MEHREAAALFDAVAPLAIYLRSDSLWKAEARKGLLALRKESRESLTAAVGEAMGPDVGDWDHTSNWYAQAEGKAALAELLAQEDPDTADASVLADLYVVAMELLVHSLYPAATLHLRDEWGGLFAELGGTLALQSDDSCVYGWFGSAEDVEDYLSDRWGQGPRDGRA